ncbi:LppX_LprAFG lipoprotein [Nocardia sp. NPDC051030]|uniref:LppX_LprAFG lipoprotein n=1 Tax=Nocardia sp. NPDC051030 TaxID=3155162 RepID=UPI003424881D
MSGRASRLHCAMAVAAMGVLTACGDGSGGLPDAGLMMRDASIASKHLGAAHIELLSEGTVPGFPLARLEVDATARDGGSGSGTAVTAQGQTIRFVQADGALFTVGPDGARHPLSAGSGVPNPSGMLGDGGLSRLLGELQDPKTVARQNVDGIDVFRIEAVVPAETVTALLPAAHTDATLTSYIRVRGVHVPVRTVLAFPGGGTLDVRIARVTAPSDGVTGQGNPK